MNTTNRFRLKIQALHEMTGSCFLFTAYYPNGKSEKFTFECGRFNGSNDDKNEFFPFDPKEVLFSICSHVHDDHVSRYPLFAKHGFNGKVYTTTVSNNLANFILYNNSQIYLKDQCRTNLEPLYQDSDVEKVLKQFSPYPYRRIVKPTKNISFVLYENGHIPGSCLVYLVISYPGEKDIVVLFTGDYNFENMFFPVPSLPECVTNNYISTIITESTYGTTNSYDISQEKKFIKIIKEAWSNGKTVIVPAFALGRVDECIYLIGEAQKSGILPSYPIYLDGYSAKNIHRKFVYDNLGLTINTRSLVPPTLKHINSLMTRRTVILDKSPKVIIAPGGCSDYGSITHYMMSGISRQDVQILYPGYVSPVSTGGKLKVASKGDTINYLGKEVSVNCNVDFTSEMSAHAKRDQIFNHIFNPCRLTNSFLVTHGEPLVSQSLANDLLSAFPKSSVGVINSNTCYTINASGIIQKDNISIY